MKRNTQILVSKDEKILEIEQQGKTQGKEIPCFFNNCLIIIGKISCATSSEESQNKRKGIKKMKLW